MLGDVLLLQFLLSSEPMGVFHYIYQMNDNDESLSLIEIINLDSHTQFVSLKENSAGIKSCIVLWKKHSYF